MKQTIIIVGLGQLGLSFARGFLKLGHPVIPLGRHDQLEADMIAHLPGTLRILMAMGEDDLAPALQKTQLRLAQLKRSADYIFLQNELRPEQWLPYCTNPTVSVVWFEQKKDKLAHEVLPSVHFGPAASLCDHALKALSLSSKVQDLECESSTELSSALAEALVLKNLYILILNLGGLRAPGSALALYEESRELFEVLFEELFSLEEALFCASFPQLRLPKQALKRQLIEAINADPDHGCAGRSAPRRLARSLEHATRLELDLPTLEAIKREVL